MKYLDTRIVISILFLLRLIILEVGKSVRINQLKNIDKTQIESMGEYEKKSKADYLKVLNKKDSEISSE